MQMHKYYIYIYYYYIVIMYIYTQSCQNTAAHVGTKPFSNLEKQCWTMLDNYDHTGKTIILPDQGFHNGRLWQIQGASMSKQPQMLPMYAMLQLRIKSCSDSCQIYIWDSSKRASFVSFHLRCCFRSAVGARLFACLTARHGVFLFTFFTARNISLWRERGSLREVGGVGNNVLLRCALI